MPTTGSRLLDSIGGGISYDSQDDIAGDCVLTQERRYDPAATPASASPASFARSGVALKHDACSINRSTRMIPSNPDNLYAPSQSSQGPQTVHLLLSGCPSYPDVVTTTLGRDMTHSLSPSTLSNTDEPTPETYLSDHGHASYSHLIISDLEERFPETQFLQEDAGVHSLQASGDTPNCQDVGSEGFIFSSALAGQRSRGSALQSSSHLISPSPTTKSSPICNENHTQQSAMSSTAFMGDETDPDAFAWSLSLLNTGPLPAMQQDHNPEFTDGSSQAKPDNEPSLSTSLDNPIVRVENYSKGESPLRIPLSRTVSKRSRGSRRSSGHLSPYRVDSPSEDELVEPACGSTVRQLPTTEDRNEDGSWKAKDASGLAGLHPHAREQMKNIVVPSLKEQEEQRNITKKNAEVEEWLTHSEVCSEVGDFAGRRPLSSRSRAKSASDASLAQVSLMKPSHISPTPLVGGIGISGPGIYVEVHSESEEDVCSESGNVHDSPPARMGSQICNDFHLDISLDSGKAAFTQETSPVRPWTDAPSPVGRDDSARYQPPTSNAAMMRFRQRAKDIESASLAATIGSMGTRRMSESDIGSLFASSGIAKPLTLTGNGTTTKGKRERRSSFLENILPKRSNSNLLKRKGGQRAQHQRPSPEPPKTYQQESEATLATPSRIGSWKRPKSPITERGLASVLPEAVPLTVVTAAPPTGPWARIKRSRSRSDVGKSLGLAELMTQHGGPPMLALTSPATDIVPTPLTAQVSNGQDEEDDIVDDDDAGIEPAHMDLSMRLSPVEPTYEGFRTHVRQLNPHLAEYMIERVTQEQVKRYNRLLDFKIKHFHNVSAHSCSSGAYCLAQGGSSKTLPPRPASKDGSSPFVGFQIVAPSEPNDGAELVSEGVVAAQFPSGVPLPPVKRLPAEFECSVCFKVKKFYKPSDWTKHIHEDVQPFTCTFPSCGEPKSFKRKADWVRHENERHRQLEKWTCDIGECSHTCFRKDNFVQHLVREHKIPEPKVRTSNAANRGFRPSNMPHGTNNDRQSGDTANFPSSNDKEYVWAVVERCRHDTTKQPKDEPCRFCGNTCNSWKKLTVHLAKHMEQISMPILALVEQKHVSADTVISPVDLPRQPLYKPSSPSVLSKDLPTCLYNELPPFDASRIENSPVLDADTRYSQFPGEATLNEVTSSAMHTYPLPQLFNHTSPLPAQKTSYMQPSMPVSGFSYPGASLSAKHGISPVNNIPRSTIRLSQNSPASAASTRYLASMPPMSIYGQQDIYSSPVDAAPFGANLLPGNYFPQGGPPSAVLASNSLQAAAGPPYNEAGVPNYDSQYGQIPAQLQSQEGFAYHE